MNACYPVLRHLDSRSALPPPRPRRAVLRAWQKPPAWRCRGRFRESRQELQAVQAARLAAGLPLPQLLLAVPVHAPSSVPSSSSVLSEALGAAIDELSGEEAA